MKITKKNNLKGIIWNRFDHEVFSQTYDQVFDPLWHKVRVEIGEQVFIRIWDQFGIRMQIERMQTSR
jgi:hypothetical protein